MFKMTKSQTVIAAVNFDHSAQMDRLSAMRQRKRETSSAGATSALRKYILANTGDWQNRTVRVLNIK